MATYPDFLRAKMCAARPRGFRVEPDDVHPELKPHQLDLVVWALGLGRAAIFANFGLGKTRIQLDILRLVAWREGGIHLIIAPLGVRAEFTAEAEAMGLTLQFIRRDEDLGGEGLYVTNYESVRDGRLDPRLFTSVSLDEADCLRSYGSKTFQTFLTLFQGVRYRFVATATPSPNRHKELIHYAGFLGVMDTGQALTRFFQRDSQKANHLTLYPHKEREFWAWVSTWAVFLQRPSDLGHSDEGYVLPKIHVHYHMVRSESEPTADRDGQLRLVQDAALSLSDASREKHASLPARIAEMLEIVQAHPDEHCILWHDLEAERHAIKQALPEAVEVYGSQDLDVREDNVAAFSRGDIKYLATKPILSGSGCNFQRHCARAVFLGIGFKFRDFIQAVHRIHRFLQTRECHIHVIFADTEARILEVLKRKWREHEELTDKMSEIIRKYGLSRSAMAQELARSIGVERIEARGDLFIAVNNDCVEEMPRLSADSVDCIITSIPFANHYEYTPSYNDFGHTDDNGHFWEQMDFLTPELLRVLRPGRVMAWHVKDRILFGNVTGKGFPTVSPFHMEAAFHAMGHGFDYMGLITVVTDVVRENNQTYRLGWSEMCKDGTKMGVGSPEYILLFRKPQTDRSKGYADVPVVRSKDDYSRARWQVDAHGFWRSSGQRLVTADEMAAMGPDDLCRMFTERSLQAVYDHEEHVRIGEALETRGALPATFMAISPGSHHPDVWHDVVRMRTLNGSQSQKGLAQHVCPLQFDIVDRLIRRYTNTGEMVMDPFAGLMTVPYRAVLMGRRGYGVELNPDYWSDGVKYCRCAEQDVTAPSLFDFCKEEAC